MQLETFPEEDRNRHKKYFDERVLNKEIFVLENSRKYIGHLTFRKSISPPFPNSIHIDEFAINPEYRGNNYGTEMINRVIKEARKFKFSKIFLETWNNPKNKALKFYDKFGFKKIGFFYGKDGEAILLLDNL